MSDLETRKLKNYEWAFGKKNYREVSYKINIKLDKSNHKYVECKLIKTLKVSAVCLNKNQENYEKLKNLRIDQAPQPISTSQ